MSALADIVIPPARHLEFVAADVAGLAAELVSHQVGHAAASRTKSTPTDVVTATDVESERLIRLELLRRCPGSAIVGEELADETGSNGVGWIVDPIDGTVNFLYDLPVISVSIAATIDGTVVAGAVADVLRGDVYTAHAGGGARLDGIPIGCSTPADASGALVGTGFAYDARIRAAQAGILAALLPTYRDIRCMGSAALNLCWVAAGRLDAFYEQDIKIYDYAAGALIAAEAGATTELPAGNDLDLMIATAPSLFDGLRRLIDRVGETEVTGPGRPAE